MYPVDDGILSHLPPVDTVVDSSVMCVPVIFAASAVHSCPAVFRRTVSPQKEKKQMRSMGAAVPRMLRACVWTAVHFGALRYESEPQFQFLFCVAYGLYLPAGAPVEESDWPQLALRVALCS